MVQKNLVILLALLWIMPQFTAKISVIPQFRKMDKVNYRQEDEIINSPQSCTSLGCSMYRTLRDGEIDIMRWERDTDIQYRHEKKEDVTGFIPKKIPSVPNCDSYGICRASNLNPLNDGTRTNDNELHQQICGTFKEMDII